MPIVADRVDAVIGVDTHTDTHSAAILSPLGAVLAERSIPADPAGYTELIAWAHTHTPGPRLAWAVEGTRAHGVGLYRALHAAAAEVIRGPQPTGGPPPTRRKVRHPRRHHRRPRRAGQHHAATPRADGTREDLRALLVCRRHYTDTRTATVNLLKSLILTADDTTRTALRARSTASQVRHLLTNTLPSTDPIRTDLLLDLARQIRVLDQTLAANLRRLRHLIHAWMPTLLRPTRRRPRHRRHPADHLVPPRPNTLRSRLRRPRRHQPHPRQQRPHHPTPTQPRRRPHPQRRPPHHRREPTPLPPTHHRLHQPPHHRRQNPRRNHPLPQALPRPTPLPPHATTRHRLTKHLTDHV